MAYIDKYGVEYSDERRAVLLRCPIDYKGEFIVPQSATTIEDGAFSHCEVLTSIQLPNGLLFIEENLFRGCINLQKIVIPNSIIAIGNGAFCECVKLEEVNLPNDRFEGVFSEIGDGAFTDCKNLKELEIPEGVTTIGDVAFMGCDNLQRLSLPSTIQKIGNRAIEDGDAIASIDSFMKKTAPKLLPSLKEIIVPKGHKQRFLEMFGEYDSDLSEIIVEK